MDSSAIRSRLAGSDGRLYWRSLGELADTPQFREYLHREFPEQASEWNDPKGRRQFLKLMSASLALAGVGACTKQPPEQIVPYVRQPEDLVPGRPLFFASAIPFSGVAQPVLVESHMGHPTKIEGNPNIRPALARPTPSRRPRSSTSTIPIAPRRVTNRGEVAAWGAFLAADAVGVSAPEGAAGSGPPVPDRTDHLAVARRADGDGPRRRSRRRSGTSTIRSLATARARPHRPQAAASDAIYHFDKADVVVSLDADFLTCGPGSVRYQKDFAARRRVTDDAQGDEPALRDREHAVADRREGGSSARAEGRRDRRLRACSSPAALGAARRARRSPDAGVRDPAAPTSRSGWPRSPRISRRTADDRWSSPAITSPPSVHALAHAMNQALGNVGTTVTYGAVDRSVTRPTTPRRSTISSRAMDAGQVELLVMLGGVIPVFTAPADLKFAEKLSQGRPGRLSRPLRRRDGVPVALELADAHPLESWGDARAYDGTVTIMQPLIAPLYEGRSASKCSARSRRSRIAAATRS